MNMKQHNISDYAIELSLCHVNMKPQNISDYAIRIRLTNYSHQQANEQQDDHILESRAHTLFLDSRNSEKRGITADDTLGSLRWMVQVIKE